jgi:hypothetical protein
MYCGVAYYVDSSPELEKYKYKYLLADSGLFPLAQQLRCSKIHFVTGATPICSFICLLGRGERGRNVMETEEVLRVGVRGINVYGCADPSPFLFRQCVRIA